jgi:hypothetical protein
MKRFWPALGLFGLLLAVSITTAFLLRADIGHIIGHLERGEEGFEEALAHWERRYSYYALTVNQSRVSEVAVQWRRVEAALQEQEDDAFLTENAVLASMLRQIVRNYEIKWYNVF